MTVKAVLRNIVLPTALVYILKHAIDNKILHLADGTFERYNENNSNKGINPSKTVVVLKKNPLSNHPPISTSISDKVEILGYPFVKEKASLALVKMLEDDFPDDDDDDTHDIRQKLKENLN
jgi:hypothetical protein